MAKSFKNPKGFLVIQCSVFDLNTIEPPVPFAICDRCNKHIFDGYIPCVLGHRMYCDDCLNNFLATGLHYPEDQDFERRVFNDYVSLFKRSGAWEA